MNSSLPKDKSQGSLEYLIIISVVLVIASIVVVLVTGTFGGREKEYLINDCISAASECESELLVASDAKCPYCNESCGELQGRWEKEFPEAVNRCKAGNPDMIGVTDAIFEIKELKTSFNKKDNILTVNTTIENTGYENGTQNISASVRGEDVEEVKELELGVEGGDNEDELKFELSFNAEEGETYRVDVHSEDDDASIDFTVDEAYFSIQSWSCDEQVNEGSDYECEAEIKNTDDGYGEREVTASSEVGDDSKTIELDSDESTTETFTISTSGDDGDQEVTTELDTGDETDTDTTTIIKVEGPFFSVDITSTNSPVEEENTLTVDTTITNTGDEAGTQTITLEINGSQKDSTKLNLNGEGSRPITLEWSTNTDDAGTYTATVSSQDDSDTVDVEITEEQYTLTVSIEGEGSTTPSEGTHTYTEGEGVTMSHNADPDWEFSEWTGDCSGSSCSLTMNSDKSVTAHFEMNCYEVCSNWLEGKCGGGDCTSRYRLYTRDCGDYSNECSESKCEYDSDCRDYGIPEPPGDEPIK